MVVMLHKPVTELYLVFPPKVYPARYTASLEQCDRSVQAGTIQAAVSQVYEFSHGKGSAAFKQCEYQKALLRDAIAVLTKHGGNCFHSCKVYHFCD